MRMTLAIVLCALSFEVMAAPATSRPQTLTNQRPKSWHIQTLRKACGLPQARILRMLRYHIPHSTRWRGLTLAVVRPSTTKYSRMQQALAVIHPHCMDSKHNTSAHCQPQCIVLQRQVCTATMRPCQFEARAIQSFDLKRPTTIKPDAGSWYETPLPPMQGKATSNALILQTKLAFGPTKARQTRAWVVVLRLQHTHPKVVFRDVSMELWSPKHQALKQLEAGGIRMESMTFERPAGMSVELTVVKKGIPTALNRCICQRLDESKRYRLTRQGFQRIHSL